MEKKTKLVLKIAAGVIAVSLIGGLLFVTNAFVGNPISAMLANRAIKQYVAENYSSLDLEVDKAEYNFKYGSYAALAYSKKSVDTKFHIYYRNGKVAYDDYEPNVVQKINTLNRLADEYSELAKKIIADELGYVNNTTMVMYDDEAFEKAPEILQLDMPFAKTLPLNAKVTIRIELTDKSLEHFASLFTKAHEAFIKNGCQFSEYSLYAEHEKEYVMIYGVTPKQIESGKLLFIFEQAARQDDGYDGVNVVIREY